MEFASSSILLLHLLFQLRHAQSIFKQAPMSSSLQGCRAQVREKEDIGGMGTRV